MKNKLIPPGKINSTYADELASLFEAGVDTELGAYIEGYNHARRYAESMGIENMPDAYDSLREHLLGGEEHG